MTSLDVSLRFMWLGCTVIGYTQVGAEGKENQTVLKEDLKRSLLFFFFLPCFFFFFFFPGARVPCCMPLWWVK